MNALDGGNTTDYKDKDTPPSSPNDKLDPDDDGNPGGGNASSLSTDGLTDDPGGGNAAVESPDDPGGGTPLVRSPNALPDDIPSLLNKVHLDGSSANDNSGSRDLNTPKLLAFSNTKASRFSSTSVTKAPLKEPTGEVMNTTMDHQDSLGTPPTDDPGGDDTIDNKDKSDDDPPLSDKVNLDGSSTNDNPGSRDFNTPKLLASSNTKASRFFFTSVTKAPLKEPIDEVMNTTINKDSLGTLLMDDPGGDNTMDNKVHIAGLWLNGMDGLDGMGRAMCSYDYGG